MSQEHLIENCSSSIPEPVTQNQNTCGTQTPNVLRLFSTELLLADDETVHYYTGLDTLAKILLDFSPLLPMAYDLKYSWSRVVSLAVEIDIWPTRRLVNFYTCLIVLKNITPQPGL